MAFIWCLYDGRRYRFSCIRNVFVMLSLILRCQISNAICIKTLPSSYTNISLRFCVMKLDVRERRIPNVETFEKVIISFVIKSDFHLFNLKFKPKCAHAEDSTIEWQKVSKPNSRLHPNCKNSNMKCSVNQKIWNALTQKKTTNHFIFLFCTFGIGCWAPI